MYILFYLSPYIYDPHIYDIKGDIHIYILTLCRDPQTPDYHMIRKSMGLLSFMLTMIRVAYEFIWFYGDDN